MKTSKKITRRALSVFIALVMLLSSFAIAAVPVSAVTETEDASSNPYRVVSYVTEWNWPGSYDPITDTAVTYVDPWRVTHINYSFGYIDMKDYTVRVPSPGKLRALVALREENPDLKILLSIGGWGADGFSEIAADSAKITKFAKSCLQVIQEYDLDGVDLDWEYPGVPGDGLDISGFDLDNDGLNQIKLYKGVREVLTWDYYLTIASGVGYDWLNRGVISEIPQYLDYITIMDYDIWGDWKGSSKYNCNLYPVTGWTDNSDGTSNPISVQTVCDRLSDMGYPKEIMVIGFPMYGRDRSSDNRGNQSWPSYSDIKKLQAEAGSALTYTFNTADGSYASSLTGTYNGITYDITYDDVQDFQAKVNWLASNGYGGVMYWEYSQDTDYSVYNNTDLYPTAEAAQAAARQDGPMTQLLYDLINAKGSAPALPMRYENSSGQVWWAAGAYGAAGNGDFGSKTTFYYNGVVYTQTRNSSSSQWYYIGWTYAKAPGKGCTIFNYTATATYASDAKVRNEYDKVRPTVDDPLTINKVNLTVARPNTATGDTTAYIGKNQELNFSVDVSGGSGSYTYQYRLAREEMKYNPEKTTPASLSGNSPNYVQLWITDQNGIAYWKGDTSLTVLEYIKNMAALEASTARDLKHADTTVSAGTNNTGSYTVAEDLADQTGAITGNLYKDVSKTGVQYYPLLNTSSKYYALSNPRGITEEYNVVYVRATVTDTVTGMVSTVYSEPIVVVNSDQDLSLKSVSIAADKTVSAPINKAITWTATPEGGINPITYVFDLYKDGVKVSAATQTSTSATFAYTPRDIGDYYVVVTATDSDGTTKSATSEVIAVYNPDDPLVIVSTSESPTPALGVLTTFIVVADKGVIPYTYALLITKDGKIYYSNTNSTVPEFDYGFMETGTYVVTYYVKDSSGQMVSEVKDITI